jgi:hypothetical protein
MIEISGGEIDKRVAAASFLSRFPLLQLSLQAVQLLLGQNLPLISLLFEAEDLLLVVVFMRGGLEGED